LGGYVKMFGETGFVEGGEAPHTPVEGEAPAEAKAPEAPRELTEEEKARSFAHKPPLARIAIVIAGPAFNLIFAWLVFIVLFMFGVPTITAKVGEVLADKPAARAGIQKGDVVTSINGKAIHQWDEISGAIAKGKGSPLTITIHRGSQELSYTITPEVREGKTLFGETVKRPAIGIAAAGEVATEHHSPFQAVVKGSEYTWKMIDLTIMSLVKMVQRVVPLDSIGGPIMIVKMAGETAQAGGMSFLSFVALLSINLGVLNLLPVPILDGGHLFFFFWELIFRKPVSQKAREYAQQIGLMLLLGLMLLAFYNDIIRYFFSRQG
jgi:regulator of sigma E protease